MAKGDRLIEFVQAKADQARGNGGTRAAVDEIILVLLLDAGLKAVEVCRLTIALNRAQDDTQLALRRLSLSQSLTAVTARGRSLAQPNPS